MKNNERTPQLGMIVALCVVLTGIWLMALYGTYKESQAEKYDVRVSPGAVSYGTHSSAVIPMVSSPMHSTSVPMISGGAIRSYAHQGHATMSSATGSGFKMHTTSSATVHTVGSGGGGGAVGAVSGSTSSSRGITYGGASVSMPTFAFVTPNYAMQASESSRNAIGPRKVQPTGGGTDGEWRDGGSGDWWYYDEWAGEWLSPWDGATRAGGPGETYAYYKYVDGLGWIPVNDQGDPVIPTPLGDAPWLLILFLAMGYGIVKVIRKKQNAI